MSQPRQVIPGSVYLVTRRCTQRQLLLRPDRATNNAFIYCLAYAARRNGLDIVAFVASSNHYHAVVVDNDGRIPLFLEEFHRLLAKHQNSLRERTENMWSSSQTSLVLLPDAHEVLDKIAYTIGNPAKDHLVTKSREWPGATSHDATLYGHKLVAQRPKHFFRRQGPMPQSIELRCIKPDVLAHLSALAYADVVQSLLQRLEDTAAADRRARGVRALGRIAVLRQSPFERPNSPRPAPRLRPHFAARSRSTFSALLAQLKGFRQAHAHQRANLIAGAPAVFPPGTWWLRVFAGVSCEPWPPPAMAA